ncbi:MAG: ribosomal RNA small subunit methyltransferase A [Sphingobacteriia bacterium]|nr:ribosomal RNA small subunit methyltransferase A [Sphingobacteriia bacterium]
MDISKLPSVKDIVTSFDIAPVKKLGQNFLFDQNLTDKIAKSELITNELILEIGPGPGGLTRSILKNDPQILKVIEPDERCVKAIENIKHTLDLNNIFIINNDARKIKFEEIFEGKEFRILANLPYNVATDILIQGLEAHKYIKSMTLMFQKEVAERINAKPNSKAYGRLSIISQNYYKTQILFEISPKAFFPAPKVTSSVIKLQRRDVPLFTGNFKTMEYLCFIMFNQRRKQIKKALTTLNLYEASILKECNLTGTERAEDLSIEQYTKLAYFLEKTRT